MPRLEIDADVLVSECDLELVNWLERMAPHGLGNLEPVFRISDARLDGVQGVGGGKHVRFRVTDGSGSAEAIGFGMGDRASELARAGRADLAFVPTRNEWNGETRVQLKLKSVRTL